RLYAEDPAKGFLPSVGKLESFWHNVQGRFETGVEEKDEISPFYDPMIAKIVVRGEDREEALNALADGCASVCCDPVKTNAWFLLRLCEHPAFVKGNIGTGFIADHLEELVDAPQPSELLLQEAAQDLIYNGWDEPKEWVAPTLNFEVGMKGFRLNREPSDKVTLYVDGQLESVAFDRELYEGATLWEVSEGSVLGWTEATYFERGAAFHFSRFAKAGALGSAAADGAILAPMPGKVTSVEVKQGEKVAKGQRLLTLEAMKMEHGLVAPFDGVVAELNAKAGAQVQVDAVMAVVEAGQE
ncbi:MAG TPA: biotin/lipoyl-containing protein, partial [Sphingomicrobium sp.]|nr:biotin/lipoyl-containing protein [Sphingomicrobium sp.]